jgi:tetratricopeptide (TPR) repeat protein
MSRSLIRALAFVALGLVPASAATANVPPAEATSASAGDELVSTFEKALFASRYADALAIAQSIKVDPDDKHARATLDIMRASALLGLKREREARKLIAEADELAPDIPEPSTTLFTGALLTEHFDIAADTLDRMIARYPDVVRDVPWELMRFFLQKEPSGQAQRNDDRRATLVRIGYGADTEHGYYLAATAVRRLVLRSDYDGASALLPFVKEPESIENMLIQRRYERMWPAIEKLAGPHLATVRADLAAEAARQYAETPDDHQAFASYVNALRHAGRLNDAIALEAKLPQTSEAMASTDEDMGWAVNNVAFALHEAGRKDEADKLLERLNDAPMPKEDWRVSMKINRLEFLVQDGEFEKALSLVEPTAATIGSPYADQLTRRLRYCTLSRLGRAAEAAKYRAEFLAHASDAPGPTIDALLCAGDASAAEQVALTALSEPDPAKRSEFETDFVRQLQAHPLASDDPSVWEGRWSEFRKRPAIASAFARLGRDLPDEFRVDTAH